MQKQLLDLVYPIGRGFIDFTDGDYSNYLGFTWERELLGMFPLGADDINYKIGNTGGAKTHTLSINEMPSHTHTQDAHSHDLNSYVGSGSDGNYSGIGGTASNQIATTKKGTTAVTAKNQKTGGGQPFSIMPPYKTVYYWKRVA